MQSNLRGNFFVGWYRHIYSGYKLKYLSRWCLDIWSLQVKVLVYIQHGQHIFYFCPPAVSDSTSLSILLFPLFYFWFWKRKYFFLLYTFFSQLLQGTLLFFLLFLFGLRARSALYQVENLYKHDFCSLILAHVLYKIYKYVILKHVAHR